ncbi:MAG: hypothetical protein ACM34K_07455 [Bacillota bacterium]
MTRKDIRKTMNRTMKKIEKVDWNKTAHNASSIAGTVGGAMALTRILTRKHPFRRRKMERVMNPIKIGAASLAVVAGGIKLLNDNMPVSKMNKTMRKTSKYLKSINL